LVAALDSSNHLVANYVGTVHFTSSDSGATSVIMKVPNLVLFRILPDGIFVDRPQ